MNVEQLQKILSRFPPDAEVWYPAEPNIANSHRIHYLEITCGAALEKTFPVVRVLGTYPKWATKNPTLEQAMECLEAGAEEDEITLLIFVEPVLGDWYTGWGIRIGENGVPYISNPDAQTS